jgi:uncharacterized membrane protein
MSGTVDRNLRAAKEPRAIVAGPYGHPFHPIAVTIPIGAWTAALVFDVIAFVADDPSAWAAGARVLVIIGLVGAVVAAALGLMDLSRLASGTPARRTGVVHALINVVAMALFALALIPRFAAGDEPSLAGFLISLVAFASLGVSGWLGGKLAYRWGVRVADETVQQEGFVRS